MKSTPFTSPTKERVLQSVGVSRQMAHQYEKLADIPEEKFEKAITEFKKEGELSRAKLLNTVKAAQPKPPVQQVTIDITPPKHPTQVVLEVVLNAIKDMVTIDQVMEYITNRINYYKNGN